MLGVVLGEKDGQWIENSEKHFLKLVGIQHGFLQDGCNPSFLKCSQYMPRYSGLINVRGNEGKEVLEQEEEKSVPVK